MAQYLINYYCKDCKKNVTAIEKSKCKKCGSTQLTKSWAVRFRAIENFQTKRKCITGFKTKKEAEMAYLDYQKQSDAEKQTKISRGSAKLTFTELYEEFRDYKQSRVKQSSFFDWDSKTKLHILPFFSDYIVAEISPQLLLKWQNTLDKYSYKYKSCLRIYLSGILKYAHRYHNIPNQLVNVEGFKNNTEKIQEMNIWSEEEFSKFINCVDRLDYKAYFSALYLTGCRKGELLATNWNDWNLIQNELNINKSITRKVYGKSWTITTPKNIYSNRKISISQSLSDLMQDYKKWYEENKKEQSNFVFGGSSPFADSNIDRYFKEKCNETNIKKIRIHDFRHSHASLLISKGASIVAVAKRLGHKDIEQTLNTYSHLFKSDESILLTKLDTVKL